VGIVSAKGRSGVGIATYEDFIQTDAAINPGNSGGPLLNLDGKVVGINTAIISRSGGNMGIGLAIPVNMAKAIYEQLIAEGKVVRGYMGVRLQKLTPELAENFGLEKSKGAIITKVMEDSPAEEAGIKFEDIIIEFQEKPVEDSRGLMKRVAMLTPGTEVELVVWRNGEKKTLTIDDKPTTVDDLGLDVKDLSDELASRLGYEDLEGVVVVEVRRGSVAQQKGIEPGMLIVKVGRVEVSNTRDFYREIKKINKGETVVLLVTDGEQKRFVTLEVPEKE
jgi:serine protease Do